VTTRKISIVSQSAAFCLNFDPVTPPSAVEGVETDENEVQGGAMPRTLCGIGLGGTYDCPLLRRLALVRAL